MDGELKTAIDRLKILFKERDSAEWWSQNIIDASQDIKKKENWTKFYSYMHNPENFDPNIDLKTMEDCEEEIDLSYPEGLEAIRYKNGNETTIHVRVKKQESDSDSVENDEKTPNWSCLCRKR